MTIRLVHAAAERVGSKGERRLAGDGGLLGLAHRCDNRRKGIVGQNPALDSEPTWLSGREVLPC
jgi:hypothetical protein